MQFKQHGWDIHALTTGPAPPLKINGVGP